jgi:hypothetical protein
VVLGNRGAQKVERLGLGITKEEEKRKDTDSHGYTQKEKSKNSFSHRVTERMQSYT